MNNEFNFKNCNEVTRNDLSVFTKLDNFIRNSENLTDVIIDTRSLTWFEMELCSILSTILIRGKEEKGLSIKFLYDSSSKVFDVLKRNGFFGVINDQNDTIIPIKKFTNFEFDDFLKYISRNFQERNFMKSESKDIIKCLAEIFSNSFMHSKGNFIFSCGQYFPNKKELCFCITDNGIGIPSLIYKEKGIKNQVEAIKWTLKDGNTTKSTVGGFGLKLLKKFIENKKGEFIIFSNRVCYNVINSKSMEFLDEFIGTSIILTIPIS